jgi:hypothetical protein
MLLFANNPSLGQESIEKDAAPLAHRPKARLQPPEHHTVRATERLETSDRVCGLRGGNARRQLAFPSGGVVLCRIPAAPCGSRDLLG